MFLFNNECKEINIYIDYLNDMLKKSGSKSTMFACIPVKPGVLIE